MNWIISLFNTSIGKKLLMALTGLFLTLFLVVHLIGNLQLLKSDAGYSFNIYAVFMTTNPIIKFASYGLYATILLHAIKGLLLAFQNYAKRNHKYAVNPGNQTSHWTSRWMGVLGTIILVFIVVHMASFWYKYKFGEVPYTRYTTDLLTGEMRVDDIEGAAATPLLASKKMIKITTETTEIVNIKDLYKTVFVAFKNPIISLFYVFCMFAMAFHLLHGFQSAFQSLGINHPKYNPLIKYLGVVISVVFPALFALIPIYVYFIK